MEWAQVDLQRLSSIHAIQVNFDEYGANQKGAVSGVYQSYLIYASVNGEDWSLVVDYGTKKTDTPHDYIEFEEPFKARYIKLQNKEYMVSENFSVRDLRIFGKGLGSDSACRKVSRWKGVRPIRARRVFVGRLFRMLRGILSATE